MTQDNMSKALDAVDSLAALVKALRHTTIDRSEYEALLCNQSDTYAEQVAHAMQTAFDDSPVALSYAERQEMVLDHAGKPARVFTQWDHDRNPCGGDYAVTQTAQIELRNHDFMRLSIPVGYTKEEAMQGLKELVQFVEDFFGAASEQAQAIAKRELPSAFAPEEIAVPF